MVIQEEWNLPRLARWFLFMVCWPAAITANAQGIPVHVSDKEGVLIKLMAGPCVDMASRAMIVEAQRPKFKAIESTWTMKDGTKQDFAGCWREVTKGEFPTLDEDGFLVVFADGAYGFLPRSDFTKAKGQSGA